MGSLVFGEFIIIGKLILNFLVMVLSLGFVLRL